MSLAIFDLDNTLLAGDSDYLWGRFLVEQGLVEGEAYERKNARFYQDYLMGNLDIHAFLAFQLRPLAEIPPGRLEALRNIYLREKIQTILLPRAQSLLDWHRERGDTLLIITATNRFITQPIAEILNVPHLIATEPERRNGRYTGRVEGIPSFREGKIARLNAWLRERGQELEGSWFYSDSHNDIPLLERVDHPVAVDPDATLTGIARRRGWPILTLR